MSYHEMVVTVVALVGIIAPVLFLTWHSIVSEDHTPSALRSAEDAIRSAEDALRSVDDALQSADDD